MNSSNWIRLKFKKLHPEAVIPDYQSDDAAGFDFHALTEQQLTCPPKSQIIIDTGLAVEVPKGHVLDIRPRSGLAFKHSITVTNSPGTVDSDYRNEIKIILFNLGEKNFPIRNGDRIAQGVLLPIPNVWIVEIDDFSPESKMRDRGGGFGSTGI